MDALSTPVLAFAADDPALTSVNFGVVEVGSAPVTVSKKVSVVNKSNKVLTYAASYLPATAMPGGELQVSQSVAVPAKATGTVVVTMTIADPKALAKTLDPTMDANQLGWRGSSFPTPPAVSSCSPPGSPPCGSRCMRPPSRSPR